MNARLHPDDVQAIAEAVAALLAPGAGDGLPQLLDAAEVARRLGRSRDWVYRHGADLGAVPMGDGDRPRLGYPADRVAGYVSRCVSGSGGTEADSAPQAAPQAAPRRRRRRQTSGDADRLKEFLPIRGER